MTKERQQQIYAETVVPLITETGFTITLTHPNNGTYDPDTGYTPSPDTTEEGVAIEMESTYESIPTSLADKIVKTIMAVEITQPVQDEDSITFKGETFKVLFVEPLETGEVLFFHTVHLGR